MPRKRKESVWQHYTSHNKTAKCNYCARLYTHANVTKMGRHLKKCPERPPYIDDEVTVKSEKTSLSVDYRDASSPENAKEQLTTAQEPPPSIGIIVNPEDASSPIYRISLKESNTIQLTTTEATMASTEDQEDKKTYLDLLLSKAIFVTRTPLTIVEHPLWLKFFEELSQPYTPPSKEKIATTYFDEIYKKMETDITEDIRSAGNLHLQCDGWSNQRVEGTFNLIIAKPEPVFLKSLNTISRRHTSRYLSQQILAIINDYGAYKFATLVGDYAAHIQKAFEIVKNRHPHIIPLSCVAHTLNLLCEDCLKSEPMEQFTKNVVDIIKTVKRSQILSSLLAKIVKEKDDDVTLKLPINSRWDSYYNVFKSLRDTKVALQTLAVHEDATKLIKSENRDHLLDSDFWTMVEECIKLLQPIKEKIFQLETNKLNIYEVYLAFRDLKSTLNFILPDLILIKDDDKENILSSIDIRMHDCISPVHLAAYMLDPRTQGVELDEEQVIESLEFINEMGELMGGDVITDLANYRAKDGLWGKSFVWKSVRSMSPVVWWKGICGSRPLSKVAVRILTVPCISTTSEHSFTNLSHIYNAKRNGLTTERAEKISFIAYNWNYTRVTENTPTENEVSNSNSILVEQEPSTSHDTSDNFEFFDVNEMDVENDSDSSF